MSKTHNVLQVLHLFAAPSAGRGLRVAEIAQALALSTATTYRYVADLVASGFVEKAADGRYVPGPVIVALDRQIRIHDPLIAAARDVMRGLSERSGGTVILARLHGLTVLCVDQVPGRHGPRTVSYERGRSMPLFRGATSLAIFAHMEAEARHRLAQTHAHELEAAGWPAQAEALDARLQPLIDAGWVHTAGQVDADAQGWAVPVHHGRRLLGSLSVVTERERPPPLRVIDALRRAVLRIDGRLLAQGETPW